MTAQLGEILARIHRHRPRPPRPRLPAAPPPGESPALAELDRYEQIFRGIAPEPHPAFELAFRWLRQRLPDAAHRRPSCTATTASATSCSGRKACARFSTGSWRTSATRPRISAGCACAPGASAATTSRWAASATREELLAAYERRRRRDDQHRRACDSGRCSATSSGRSSASCRRRPISTAWCSSVELASLGRRTAETELELLALIQAS